MKRWNKFKTSDVPALNRILRDGGLPEVHIESDPHKEEAVMDEE
jgi:hypothetical protein